MIKFFIMNLFNHWITFLHFLLLSELPKSIMAKEIDSKTDLIQEESMDLPEERTFPSIRTVSNNNVQQNIDDQWPLNRPEIPKIKVINVKCEKNHMKVNLEFDRPFYGMIFSKGHYSDTNCIHLPAGTGHLVANFDIFMGSCGMSNSERSLHIHSGSSPGPGLFIENIIIIQYDPQVQEIWDQARRLRCTWYDFYEKSVSFRPFNVDMLDAVTANFLGDNIQCWMQIQSGKGPWSNEVSGIVKIGQTMTLVLAIKDDDDKFDMLVRNCVAHDGKHQPIQLVDEFGCVVRTKIMSRFQKVKNFGNSATVVSYAYFQAFKFPDSMNVHFQCVIQVCRYGCPEPACNGNVNTNINRNNDNDQENVDPREQDGQFSESKITVKSPGPVYKGTSPTTFVKRKGDTTEVKENDKKVYTLKETGGMPRSVRRRRQLDQNSYKNIRTQKAIQVVAPGDISFTFNPEETIEVLSNKLDKNIVCVSYSGFLISLVLLLFMLVLSTIVGGFFYFRIRNITKSVKKGGAISYEPRRFVKMPPMMSVKRC